MQYPYRTAILIDDEPVSLFLLMKILSYKEISETGYPFTSAITALNYLSENAFNITALPDLVLIDIKMPEMDGWTFLKALDKMDFIKEWQPVICTMSAAEVDLERVTSKRIITEHFIKPVTSNKILSLIDVVTEKKRIKYNL